MNFKTKQFLIALVATAGAVFISPEIGSLAQGVLSNAFITNQPEISTPTPQGESITRGSAL